jgi:hypothetical protein
MRFTKYLQSCWTSRRAMLSGVLICEIIGGGFMLTLPFIPEIVRDRPEDRLLYGCVGLGGTILFSMVATRLLRARAKALEANIL